MKHAHAQPTTATCACTLFRFVMIDLEAGSQLKMADEETTTEATTINGAESQPSEVTENDVVSLVLNALNSNGLYSLQTQDCKSRATKLSTNCPTNCASFLCFG